MNQTKFFKWDQEYSVGVPEIDGQHKELMNLLNEVIYHSSDNKEEERIYFDKRIENTVKFIATHFETEEQYLSKTDYEKYTEHKLEHKNLLEKMQNIKDEVQNNKLEVDLFSLTEYLKDWFVNHIKVYDKNDIFLEKKKTSMSQASD
jgi:hemerythrin-like metal-binding protein